MGVAAILVMYTSTNWTNFCSRDLKEYPYEIWVKLAHCGRTDTGVTGILLAHPWAFGSSELKRWKHLYLIKFYFTIKWNIQFQYLSTCEQLFQAPENSFVRALAGHFRIRLVFFITCQSNSKWFIILLSPLPVHSLISLLLGKSLNIDSQVVYFCRFNLTQWSKLF